MRGGEEVKKEGGGVPVDRKEGALKRSLDYRIRNIRKDRFIFLSIIIVFIIENIEKKLSFSILFLVNLYVFAFNKYIILMISIKRQKNYIFTI